MRALVPYVVVIASGLLYGLCFPPVGASILAWVVLVPALVELRRASLAHAVVLAALLALSGTVATVHWLPAAVTTFFHQSFLVAWGLFGAVALLMVVPPYVFALLIYRRLATPPRWWLPLAAAAAWVVGEHLRAHLWTGNPWVLFGYSQARVTPVVQIADVTSVYGVSFALIVVNVALAELWLAWRDHRGLTRSAYGGAVVAPPQRAANVCESSSCGLSAAVLSVPRNDSA
jgi:apolipoprotein N-acyltransferase